MFSKPEEVARFANSVCDNDGPAQGVASAKSKLLFLIGGQVIGWRAADTGIVRAMMKELKPLRQP